MTSAEGLRRPVVGILQPSYLPWLGAFDLMAVCDTWVFLDDAQYTRHPGWRNRNRIKTPKGPEYLTVPVRKAPLGTPILSIEIDSAQPWAARHRAKLVRAYEGCRGLPLVLDCVDPVLSAPPARLAPLCTDLTVRLAGALGLGPAFLHASELGIGGRGPERILQICRRLGARTYVNGAAGRALYERERFEEAGIDLVFQEYRHPEYDQPHPPFVSHLSVVDLLVSHAPEEALRILRSGSNLPAAGSGEPVARPLGDTAAAVRLDPPRR